MTLKNSIDKFYPYPILLDTKYYRRMHLIERVTVEIGTETRFLIFTHGVLRQSARLNKSYKCLDRSLSGILKSHHFKQIAEKIDFAHSNKLFHGDLHSKNIMSDGQRIEIIDWEPSCRQITNGIASMKCTYPFIHPWDLKNREFTALSDYLCFVRLRTNKTYEPCLSILNSWYSGNQVKSMKSLSMYLQRNLQ